MEKQTVGQTSETVVPSRFDYVKYDETAVAVQNDAKAKFQGIEDLIDSVLEKSAGRARALAHTKLEECYMWIGKAIRDAQIERNGSAELQESRKNG